jgi:diketogulonate reductase-like aldo/keto reductase
MASSPVIPAVNQIELHPYLQRREVVQFCRENGIILEAYSPLTKGQRLQDPRLVRLAERYTMGDGKHVSTAQVLLRWCVQQGYVVLPKSVTPSRIEENFQVQWDSKTGGFELSAEDMEEMAGWEEYLVTGWDPLEWE